MPRAAERGAGLVPTLAGVTVFLALLLVAVQVVYDLYATSAVTAAAYDAARVVAGSDADGRAGSVSQAEGAARRVLGDYGARVQFSWNVGVDTVELRVVANNPGFLPVALRRPLGADRVDRTVVVRRERVR